MRKLSVLLLLACLVLPAFSQSITPYELLWLPRDYDPADCETSFALMGARPYKDMYAKVTVIWDERVVFAWKQEETFTVMYILNFDRDLGPAFIKEAYGQPHYSAYSKDGDIVYAWMQGTVMLAVTFLPDQIMLVLTDKPE